MLSGCGCEAERTDRRLWGRGRGEGGLAFTHPAQPAAAPLWSNESSSLGQAEETKEMEGVRK